MTPAQWDDCRCVDDRQNAGFVLILVLWSLIMLSLIAASAMTMSRTEIKARATLNQTAELQTRADGFARLAALRLTDRRTAPDGSPRIPTNGVSTVCRDGDVLIEIRIEDAAGRVDLNAASQQLLELVLVGADATAAEASQLAARILDYRDPDDVPNVGGAETAEYVAAGRAYGPKNALFDSVDELDQVLGMTPELLDRLRSLVTVHSRLPGVDFSVASPNVLRALGAGAQGQAPPQILATRSPARAFHVTVTATRGTRRATRASVIELVPRATHGFLIREWGAGLSSGTPDRDGPITQSCAN